MARVRASADVPAVDTRVGARIKKLREEGGFSLSGLAAASDVSKGYLWSLEKGDTDARPSGQTLYRVARALGVTMSDLIGQSVLVDEPPSKKVPASLKEFAKREGLTDRDVQMLAAVNFRGQQPKDADSWEFVWQAIRRSVRTP